MLAKKDEAHVRWWKLLQFRFSREARWDSCGKLGYLSVDILHSSAASLLSRNLGSSLSKMLLRHTLQASPIDSASPPPFPNTPNHIQPPTPPSSYAILPPPPLKSRERLWETSNKSLLCPLQSSTFFYRGLKEGCEQPGGPIRTPFSPPMFLPPKGGALESWKEGGWERIPYSVKVVPIRMQRDKGRVYPNSLESGIRGWGAPRMSSAESCCEGRANKLMREAE